MNTAFLANLTEAEFKALWDAVVQYVDNADDTLEDAQQPAEWHAAQGLIGKFDAYFAKATGTEITAEDIARVNAETQRREDEEHNLEAGRQLVEQERTQERARFDLALAQWLNRVNAMLKDHHGKKSPYVPLTQVTVDPGGVKYLRVVSSDGREWNRSAFAFIEVATGNVLKPDGWKGPARGARGNIYTGDLGVGPYGALRAR